MFAGQQVPAGLGMVSTILPDMDYETYSEAGFVWVPGYEAPPSWVQRGGHWTAKPGGLVPGRWTCLPNAAQGRKGLPIVGAAAYATHPSTEVLSFAYDLKDGRGYRWWRPGQPAPVELFNYLQRGGLIEAHHSAFEHWIWNYVCTRLYGWPWLNPMQLRCSMAKARAHALPGGLDPLTEVLATRAQKDPEGKRLLDKFSIPRNPTVADSRTRLRPEDDPIDGPKLYGYNVKDIQAEAEASLRCPDLSPVELEFWQAEQRINHRGVAINLPALDDCISIVQQALAKYGAEMQELTGGIKTTEVQQLLGWLHARGLHLDALAEDDVTAALERIPDKPEHTTVRRVLEIRALTASASVKKLFAIKNQLSPWGSLHDLFVYHGARTGRETGEGPQPHNLAKAGPGSRQCTVCGRHYGARLDDVCPWCGAKDKGKTVEWGHDVAKDALRVIATRQLAEVERVFVSPLAAVAGCLRGLFVARPGKRFISSDYSAIEGVVTAALAGEEWRLEVYRTHGKIYEQSAARAFGVPFETILQFFKDNDRHHPLRDKGKRMELGLGFGGWIGALRSPQIDYPGTDDELKAAILKWRAASPAIVEFWGGQGRWRRGEWCPELYGLEGMAVAAIMNPGYAYAYRGIQYVVQGDALYCILPSGRRITYHRPRLEQNHERPGLAISYEGWNTNPKSGALGWIRMYIYGGKFAENVVQAVARDILVHAIVQLERAGYFVVLHVHDELVLEVDIGRGSLEEVERIMSTLPAFATGWPVKAKGGWEGPEFRK